MSCLIGASTLLLVHNERAEMPFLWRAQYIGFGFGYSYSLLRSVAHYHVGGSGSFGPVQDVFRASQGLSRSSKDRTITREVVWSPFDFLANIKN